MNQLLKRFEDLYPDNNTILNRACTAIWYYTGILDSNDEDFDYATSLNDQLQNNFFSEEELDYVVHWYTLGVQDNKYIYEKSLTKEDTDAFLLHIRQKHNL